MWLEIISPEKIIYEGEIALVQMPGEMGSFEIMNNHAPLVSLLEKGRVKVIDTSRNMFFVDISSGVVKVKDNQIIILADGHLHTPGG